MADPNATVLYIGNGDVCSPVDSKHIDTVVCRLLRRAGPSPPDENRLLPCDGFARGVNIKLEEDEPVMRVLDQETGLSFLSCRWEGIGQCSVSPVCDTCFTLTIGCVEDMDWTCYAFKCPSRRQTRRYVEAVKYKMDNPGDDSQGGNSRRSSLQPGNDLITASNLKRTSSLSPRPRPGHDIRRHPSDRLSPVPAARRMSGRPKHGSFRRGGNDARRLKSLPCIAALSINMSLLVRQFQTISGDPRTDADLLKLAIESNDVGTVSRVLDIHYDLFNVDFNVTTALDGEPNRTRKLSDSLTVQVLLNQSKALIGQLEKGINVEEDHDAKSVPPIYHNALHLAVLNGSADVVRILLKCGVDPNCEGVDTDDRYRRFSGTSTESSESKASPRHSSTECIRDKLSTSAIKEYFTKSALFLAVHMGNAMIVRMLLNYGARVDGKDPEGRSPLHVAACALNDRWECAVQLIQFGAKIMATDNEDHRPVDSAPALSLLQLRVVQDTLEVFNPKTVSVEESPSRRRMSRSSSRDSRKMSLGLLAIPRLVARVTRSRSPASKERSNTVAAFMPSSVQETIIESPVEETPSFHEKRVRKTSLWGWFDRRRKSRDDFKHMDEQCDGNTSSTRTLHSAPHSPTIPQEILVNGENIDSNGVNGTSYNASEEDADCEAFATDRSLLILQRLSTNPECLCALLDRLPNSINKLIGLAQSLGGHLQVFLSSLLTNLLQATNERWALQLNSREEREHVLSRSETLTGLFRLAVPCVAGQGGVRSAALAIVRFVLQHRLQLPEEGCDEDDAFLRVSNRNSRCSRTSSSGFDEDSMSDRRSVGRSKSEEPRGNVIRRDQPNRRSLKWIGRPASVAVDSLVAGRMEGYHSPGERTSGSYGWEREVEQRLQGLKQRLLSSDGGHRNILKRLGRKRRSLRGRFIRRRGRREAFERKSVLANVRLALRLLASVDVALLLDCLKNITKCANNGRTKLSPAPARKRDVKTNDAPSPPVSLPGVLKNGGIIRDVYEAQMLSARALLTISSLPTTRRALMRPEYLWRLLGIMEPNNEKRFLCLLLQVVETLSLDPANHAALLAAGLAYRLEKIYRDILSLSSDRDGLSVKSDSRLTNGETCDNVMVLKVHTTRVMVYLGLLELISGYNQDGSNLLEMEAEVHHPLTDPLSQPEASQDKAIFETLLQKTPHQSLERMVAMAICLHGDAKKCNSRVVPQDEYPAGSDTDNNQTSQSRRLAAQCTCAHCRFQDALLETLAMCVHPVILLRVVQHILLTLININEGWGRRSSLKCGRLDDKRHIQNKVLCMLQRWCILIPEDFVGDQVVRKESSILLRRLGTLGSCTELNHVTRRIQSLTHRPQPNRSFRREKEPKITRTSHLRHSARSLQHSGNSGSSIHSLRLPSADSADPNYRGKLSVSSIASTLSGGTGGRPSINSITSKASSNGSINTISTVNTLPVVDRDITRLPVKDLDQIYTQTEP